MTTYQQDVKEKSRWEIWARSITSLTTERTDHYILKPRDITRRWDYAFYEVLEQTWIDEYFLNSWCEFSNTLNKTREPQQLKIAYFCGPEPENDLEIMLQLGVRIENIWAIESDNKCYDSALNKAKEDYPTLKIFNGPIADLIKISPMKFDIIYLDFTGPLFSKESKPLSTIHSIFETQALNDLGILVVNSSVPDIKKENVDFLSSYFRSHAFLEKSIYSGDDDDSDYWEGADTRGYEDDEKFNQLIKDNFAQAYGAFSTHYPAMIAGYVLPIHRIANSDVLKKIFLNESYKKLIGPCLKKMTQVPEYHKLAASNDIDLMDIDLSGGEVFEEHEQYPVWNFILGLKGKGQAKGLCEYWYQQYSNKTNGGCSYFDSVKLYDLLKVAKYSYQHILSENLSNSIAKIMSALPDPHGGRFCDVPMPHLWIELALNQLGSAYHVYTDKHWRAKYTAKTREMYLDVFVFDKCRALYDWLPMLDLYGEDLMSIERQMIIRSCLDIITKQNHYSSLYNYYGANIIGVHTKPWSAFGELKSRDEIVRQPDCDF